MHMFFVFFFFNDTATTEIYTLSLHDALPIWVISTEARAQVLERYGRLPDAVAACVGGGSNALGIFADFIPDTDVALQDRKSTRLNSSHANISYAVFCLKKKKKQNTVVHYDPI